MERTKKSSIARVLIAATPVILVVALLVAPAAQARVWFLKGVIAGNLETGSLPADMPLGTEVVFQITIDEATVMDAFPGDITQGEYVGAEVKVYIYSTSIGMQLVTLDGFRIRILDDFVTPGNFTDAFNIEPTLAGTTGTNGALGLTLINFVLLFDVTNGTMPTAVPDDKLPLNPPVPIDFTDQHVVALTAGVPSGPLLLGLEISSFDASGTNNAPLLPFTQTMPIPGVVVWSFSTLGIELCVSGCWIDPPTANSFTYSMTNSALFTGIVGFPTGFSGNFEVSVGGTSLGTFGPGQSVDFSGFAGGGVSEFVVSGINPILELNNPEAFPLQISFDTNDADFTMTSGLVSIVPSLSLPGMIGLVSLMIGVQVATRRQAVNRRT